MFVTEHADVTLILWNCIWNSSFQNTHLKLSGWKKINVYFIFIFRTIVIDVSFVRGEKKRMHSFGAET